jgi:hypothetical protein
VKSGSIKREAPGGGLVQEGEVGLLLHQGVVVPAREVDVVEVHVGELLHALFEAGAADGRAGFAGEVGLGMDGAPLGDDDHRAHGEVGLGEVDLLLALRSDAERACDDVALAAEEGGNELGERGLDRVDFQADAQGLREAFQDLVVDPVVVIEVDLRLDPDEGALLVREGEHDELAVRLDVG